MTSGEVRHEFGWVREPGGLALYWQGFRASEANAVLVFVPGLAEHSGRYLNPLLYFAQRGFCAYALDCRGHGRSPGRRVHVGRFDEYLADVAALLALVRERHPGRPVFLVGHSLGGLIALAHVLRSPSGLSGLVLSSPSLGVHPAMRPSRALALVAHTLSHLLPGALLDNHVDPAALCRDPEVVLAYRTDPLISRRVSARWFTSVMAAMGEAHAHASRLVLPALVMAAGADRVVSSEATRRWAEKAPGERVELVVWDGFFHELFNEPDRKEVLRKVETWIETRLGPSPA